MKIEEFESFTVYESFSEIKAICEVPVIKTISLTEEQPDETLLHSLSQTEIHGYRKKVAKRLFGLLLGIL